MHGPLACLFVWTLGFPVTVLATKDDPDYSPAENFRPSNVTGLNSDLYAWVGSYYNGTTEVQITPQMGRDPSEPLCGPLVNYTKSMTWNSILTITERGPYNTGSNPVNIWLTLIPPNYNLSSLPFQESLWYNYPFWLPLDSTMPIWRDEENTTVVDNFNVTVNKFQNSFSLAGMLNDTGGSGTWSYDGISMSTCNSTEYYGNWTLSVLDVQGNWWWSTKGWKAYTLPIMNVTFDTQTANLTLNGDFQASPFVRSNSSDYVVGSGGTIGPGVQGTIGFTFRGALDAYHSDILNTNSSSPTWLRTVGFGNNSLNIDNSSAATRLYPAGGQWAITAIIAISVFILFY